MAGSPACVCGFLRRRDHRTWQSRPHRKLWRHRNDQSQPSQQAGRIWNISTWCSILVGKITMAPNRCMASRIRLLRLQEPFAVHAAEVRRFLTSHELLVAHNAAFDIRFINREMRLSGLPALTSPVYCTMKGYRALEPRRQRFSKRGLSATSSSLVLAICTTRSRTPGSRCRSIFGCTAARFGVDCVARFLALHPTCVTCDRRYHVVGQEPRVPTFVKEQG